MKSRLTILPSGLYICKVKLQNNQHFYFDHRAPFLFVAHLRLVWNAAETQAEKYLLNESECYYTHSHTARQNQYELCFKWEMLLLVPASQFLQFVPISCKWSMPFKAKYQ